MYNYKILAYTQTLPITKAVIAINNKYTLIEFYGTQTDLSHTSYLDIVSSNPEIKFSEEDFNIFIDNNIENFCLNEIAETYTKYFKLNENLFLDVVNFNKNLKYTFLKEDVESCLDTYPREFFLDTYEDYKIKVLKLTDTNLKKAEMLSENAFFDFMEQKNKCNKLREKTYPNNFNELNDDEQKEVLVKREIFNKEVDIMKKLSKDSTDAKNYIDKVKSNISKLESATRKLLVTKNNFLNNYKKMIFINEHINEENLFDVCVYTKENISFTQFDLENLHKNLLDCDAIVVNCLTTQNEKKLFELFNLNNEVDEKKLLSLSSLSRSFYNDLSSNKKLNVYFKDFCGDIANDDNTDDLSYLEKLYLTFFQILNKTTIYFEKDEEIA